MEIINEIYRSESISSENIGLINDEITFFHELLNKIDLPIKIDKVIFTSDFQNKVNSFYGQDSFNAIRSHGQNTVNVTAKYCIRDEESVLFISPSFFFNYPYWISRLFVFFHEIFHVVNKPKLIYPPKTNFSNDSCFFTLYWLFDEYSANRKAYEIIESIIQRFPDNYDQWITCIESDLSGYENFFSDPENYSFIINEIQRFRTYQINVNEYSEIIKQLASDVSVTIIHAVSILHSFKDHFKDYQLKESKFVNNNTKKLIDFLQEKYEKEEFDLRQGLEVTRQYFTNFGFLIEERKNGPYCNILDI